MPELLNNSGKEEVFKNTFSAFGSIFYLKTVLYAKVANLNQILNLELQQWDTFRQKKQNIS